MSVLPVAACSYPHHLMRLLQAPPLLMSLLLSSAIRKWRFRPCQKDSNLRTNPGKERQLIMMRRERVFMSKEFFFSVTWCILGLQVERLFFPLKGGNGANGCTECWKNKKWCLIGITLWRFLLGENSYSTLFLSNEPFLYYSWRNWREPSWHLRNPSHVDFLALGYCHFTLFALRMLQGNFFQILICFFISLQAVYCGTPTLPSWGLTYTTWPIWSMHLAMSVCKRTFLLLLRLFCRFF